MMGKFIRNAALALAATGLLAAPAVTAGERLTGEAKLAKMLEGRVAGEPTSCVNTYANTDMTVIDGTALVFKRGSTLYVNRTLDPDQIDQHDTLVTRTHGSRLCRHDIVYTIDLPMGFYTGNVFLTDFVPYRKES